MKKPTIKQILKFFIIGYLLYLFCTLPKKHWDAKINISTTKNEQKIIYYPKQCSYVQYAAAWWMDTINSGKINQIIDEHILAKIGIKLD